MNNIIINIILIIFFLSILIILSFIYIKSLWTYINDLYIPPSYKDVKINLNKNEKVLAIGYDNKGRSQYIYNKKFIKGREKSKYKHMIDFGESYKRILNQIKKDLFLECMECSSIEKIKEEIIGLN